jgi:hypothetical protein
MERMGWQAHTVRGFIAGALKGAGFEVESFRPEGGQRTYRIHTSSIRSFLYPPARQLPRRAFAVREFGRHWQFFAKPIPPALPPRNTVFVHVEASLKLF